MRVLGLDLGTKTLGVAVSDATQTIATGLKTIRFSSESYVELADALKSLIEEYQVELIVLGLPKNMDNTTGFAAQRSIDFKDIIESKLKVKVELQDERLSSVSANNVLIKADLSRKKRKKKVDTVAATIILQTYLDKRKGMKNG